MDYIPKNWYGLYPMYVDKAFSKNDGRKTDLANSCENPTLEEISQVLQFLKIPHGIEQYKRHPKDFFRFGRIRYNLQNEEKKFYNEEVPTKRVLYKKLGAMIPKLKSRTDEATQGHKHFKHGKRF